MNGQKEMLVPQLGDERELVFDQLAERAWRASGKAARESCFGELAQIARRRFALGHELGGIFVAQRPEIEAAALGDAHGLLR